MRSTSDKSFFEFLRSKNLVAVGIMLAVGLSLLLIGGLFDGEERQAAQGEEERTAELCAMVEGVGECRVMMTYRDGAVYAVAIVCEGAESSSVRYDLTSLICSLYGIGANRVQILSLTESDKS